MLGEKDAVASPQDAHAPAVPTLRRDLEELGLSPYEARVLVALLQLGQAGTSEVTRVADVPRTSTYQVLEALHSKGLAVRLPGGGRATWTTPGSDQVLDRLDMAQEEHLKRYRARTSELRSALAELTAKRAPATLPYAQLLHSAGELWRTYIRLLGAARSELLMFTRSPFVAAGTVNPAVLEALERGVQMRVIYWRADLESASPLWLEELEAYHAAGVDGRVVDDLPIKLMAFDRRACLVGMPNTGESAAAYPTFLLIDHPGYTRIQAAAFEKLWDDAAPYGRARLRAR